MSLSDKVTYTLYNKMQPFKELAVENRVGLYNYPQWKNNLRLSWRKSRFRADLLLRSYAGQKQENEQATPLPSHSELDMTINYKILNHSVVNLGGKNILSETPPTQDSQVNRFNGNLYSQRGPRFFSAISMYFNL